MMPTIDGITSGESANTTVIGYSTKSAKFSSDDFSVKSIQAAFIEDRLYIGVDYHNKKRKPGRVRQGIRITAKGVTSDNFQIIFGGEYDDWSIMEKHPQVQKNSEQIIMNDISAGIELLMKQPPLMTDPPDEHKDKAELYDIKDFRMGGADGKLICLYTYHNDISKLNFLIHTIYIITERETYLVQWNSRSYVKNHYWRSKTGFSDNQLYYNLFEYDKAFAFIIDLKAINNEKITAVHYSAGSKEMSGKTQIHGSVIRWNHPVNY